jgi:hypothetical protein
VPTPRTRAIAALAAAQDADVDPSRATQRAVARLLATRELLADALLPVALRSKLSHDAQRAVAASLDAALLAGMGR